jgi:hypothetical protein
MARATACSSQLSNDPARLTLSAVARSAEPLPAVSDELIERAARAPARLKICVDDQGDWRIAGGHTLA